MPITLPDGNRLIVWEDREAYNQDNNNGVVVEFRVFDDSGAVVGTQTLASHELDGSYLSTPSVVLTQNNEVVAQLVERGGSLRSFGNGML